MMCNFFSLVSDGSGKPLYFNWSQRQQILAGQLNYTADSHTSIADFHGFKAAMEDRLNKYEYNPLTKVFVVDQLNTTDDSADIERFCKAVDFKTIVKPLHIKKIINPLTDFQTRKVSKRDILCVKKWASVWDSVWASVRGSVWVSVGGSVRASVWDSVWASVGASVRASVWGSVGDAVGGHKLASVWDSVWASVETYCSSFICCEYNHDFSPAVKLWERGLVPSFDGGMWRLHGAGGMVLWTKTIRGER